MSPITIHAEDLSKTYKVPEREGGFGAAVQSFFKRKYKDVKAVQHVNFEIAQGEVVVVNDKFGIRLTDIITPAERIRKLNK